MNRLKPLLLPAVAALLLAGPARAQIAASHVYHNHMPNFWPYYDVSKYASTPVGGAIRYTYDGQVINLKQNPPSNYTYYLPSGAPMPHDDLVTYYSHHAKTGAYLYWPPSVAADMNTNASTGQVHVTMSGAVVNNVQDLNALQNVAGYNNTSWGSPWRDRYNTLRTPAGTRTLDLIHFTGHHTGPHGPVRLVAAALALQPGQRQHGQVRGLDAPPLQQHLRPLHLRVRRERHHQHQGPRPRAHEQEHRPAGQHPQGV